MSLKKVYDAEVGYYGDRPKLDQAWANLTNHYKPHEITANKIHAEINPNWADNQPAKVSKIITDRAIKNAAERGMDLNEYLDDLMNAEEYDAQPDPEVHQPDPELDSPEVMAMLDDLDRQFAAKKSRPPQPTV